MCMHLFMFFKYHDQLVISSYSVADRQSSQGVQQAWTTIYQQVVAESGQLLGAVYDSFDGSSFISCSISGS